MAKDNKLPYLFSEDSAYHTVIIDEIDDEYLCYNRSTNQKITIKKDLLEFIKPEIVKQYTKHETKTINP